MSVSNRLSLVFIVSLFALLPSGTSAQETNLISLNRNAFAYIFTDVQRARPIIELLPVEELKNWQAIYVKENTNIAAAALFHRNSGIRFQAAGRGSYPQFRAGLALFFHPNWRRQRTQTGHYWYSVKNRLSVSINTDEVFVASWHDNHVNPVPDSYRVQIPEGFAQFAENAPLSCWLNEANQFLNQILDNARIPLNFDARQLFINLAPVFSEDGAYQFEATLRIRFPNAAAAQTASAALQAVNFSPSSESDAALFSVFFANHPVLYGHDLEIKTAKLSQQEIDLLLQIFISFWT